MIPAGKALPGPPLMEERPKWNLNLEGQNDIRRRWPERTTQVYPWTFEHPHLGVFEKALKRPLHLLIMEVEGGLEIIQHLLADVLGEVGRKHSTSSG
jgi:hypothetical protein